MPLVPVALSGAVVTLEPLSLARLDGLCACGLDPALWRWIPRPVLDRDAMHAYIELALQWQREGTALPFAIIDNASGKPVGSTRFANYDGGHKRVEIGWTWLARAHQRTGANTEMKFLMLRHAFETLGLNRVELKTDALNAQSRAAILRIGAVEEGTIRRHMIAADGRVRDTVCFSVIREDWPRVRRRFEGELFRK